MKDSPKPPDPYQTAAAQSDSSIRTARANQGLNMVNQVNPYGSLTYSRNAPAVTNASSAGSPSASDVLGTFFGGGKGGSLASMLGAPGGSSDPSPGEYTATTALSGPMQGIFDKSTGLANSLLGGSAGGALSGKPLDLSYNGTTAALDKLNHARLDPQWAQNTDTQESKLAAQGLNPGTPAYDNAMRVFNQGKNDAYNSANLADYQTSANNATTEYNAPLNTLGSVYGIANMAGKPAFGSTPQANVAGTNIAGLINDNYKQQSANANAQNGQISGLIGAGLGAVGTAFGGPLGGMAGSALGKSMGGLFGGGSPSGYGTG